MADQDQRKQDLTAPQWPDGHPEYGVLVLAFDGELETRDAARVRKHLRECHQCEARWERLTALSGRLVAFEEAQPAIAVALPPLTLEGMPSQNAARGARHRYSLPMAAAAAFALMACAWWALRPGQTSSPGAVHAPQHVLGGGVADLQTSVGTDHNNHYNTHHSTGHSMEQRAVATGQPRSHARHARSLAQAARPRGRVREAESEGLFWSLPYSNPELAAEGGQLIRVAMPREAFLMAGVPALSLPPVGAQDLIAADVWLGSDGLPSAIRPARHTRR